MKKVADIVMDLPRIHNPMTLMECDEIFPILRCEVEHIWMFTDTPNDIRVMQSGEKASAP